MQQFTNPLCTFAQPATPFTNPLATKVKWFAVALIMSSSTVAQAAVVSLDFNTTGGNTATGNVGVLPGQTGLWSTLDLGASDVSNNKAARPSALNMNDGTGVATTIDFYLNTTSATNITVGSNNWRAYASGTPDDLREDVAYLTSGTSPSLFWVIEGLVPNGIYNLAMYGQFFSGSFVNPGQWTIGATTLANWNGSSVTGQVSFSGVTANGAGQIGGIFSELLSDPSPFSSWSGLQIQSVPEPSAVLLGGLGLLALLRRRR